MEIIYFEIIILHFTNGVVLRTKNVIIISPLYLIGLIYHFSKFIKYCKEK